MEVSNYKISIMQVDIQRRVTKEDTGQATGDKHAHKTNGKQHTRCEPDITAPKRRQPVKHLNRRRHGDQQRQQHEYRTQEWIQTRYEHMVRPYEEGQDRNGEHRTNHRHITKDRLACIDRHDLRNHTHGR